MTTPPSAARAAIALFVAACASTPASAQGTFSCTRVLAGTDFSQFLSAPSINADGEIAFTAVDTAGGSGVFAVDARRGGIITIQGGNFGALSPSLAVYTRQDYVTFRGSDATGPGIFAAPAAPGASGPILTLKGRDFGLSTIDSFDISSNTSTARPDDWNLVVSGRDAGGQRVLQTAHWDPGEYSPSSTVQLGDPDLLGEGAPFAVAEDGDVVFTAVDGATGQLGVFASPLSGGNLITITGQNFDRATSIDTTRNGNVLYSGTTTTGESALYTVSGGGQTGTIDWSVAADPTTDSLGTVALSESGVGAVAVTRASDNGELRTESIIVCTVTHLRGGDPFIAELISVGDAVDDGRIVSGLSFTENGVNSLGEFVFLAEFTDGSSDLFIARIPAPAGGVALGGGLALTFLNRRRSAHARA